MVVVVLVVGDVRARVRVLCGSSGGGSVLRSMEAMHSYTERWIATWKDQGHAERRRGLKIGNPIGRQAEKLDQEARVVERQENQAGMGRVRKELLADERAAMSAEDQRR